MISEESISINERYSAILGVDFAKLMAPNERGFGLRPGALRSLEEVQGLSRR